MEKGKKGKLWSTVKDKLFGNKKSIVAMLALTIGNLFALSVATYAWFCTATNSSSSMDTFSGDLDVSIEKVSAYKYIFPYHNNSADFIDYDGVGQVKSYVVQDSSIETPSSLATVADFQVSALQNKSYATSSSDEAIGSTKVHYENSQTFKYYLMGDSTFTGVTDNEWSSLSATAFSRRDAPTLGDPVIVTDVVVSCGATFTLFDVHSIDGSYCTYYSYASPTLTGGSNSRFAIVEPENVGDFPRLQCLESGIYTFEFLVDGSSNNHLKITLQSRDDNAIIGTNMIDPTKISIDYRGNVSHSTYPTIQSYLPDAIQNQNTMVVLDVEILYNNKNPIDAGLEIRRETQGSNSIYGFSGKYNTTAEYTLKGYVNESEKNPLDASDFYAFYSVIAKDANKYATPTAAWNDLHALKTNAEVNSNPIYNKFQNDTTYDRKVISPLNPKTNNDSSLVPGSMSDNRYHIYIAVEYDYEYMAFFVNQNRLGKTFLLDRDFGFYFSATQHLENPSSTRLLGGKR